MIWSSWHCTAVFICNDAAVSSLVVLFSVNLIRPVFSTLSWDSSLFVSCFPPKQSFRVVVAFWCHRHYQQVFELCVNQHKHFDDTVLLSLVMELNWVVEETGQCFASRWRLGFRETTDISWLQKVGFVRKFTLITLCRTINPVAWPYTPLFCLFECSGRLRENMARALWRRADSQRVCHGHEEPGRQPLGE